MLNPITITEQQQESYLNRINLKKFRMADARNDPIAFAKYMIGFQLRDYQIHLMDNIIDFPKVAIVKGRQIGFSTTISLFCLWFAWFNKNPSGANKNTKICVISKDDDSAKKLLQTIKDFMYMGDRHMSAFLAKYDKQLFTNEFFSQNITQNNADILKLKNGSMICSFPPTGKVRGGSFDIVFIDEFAFLNNTDEQKFYYTDVLPTISETGGKIIISSTPNGMGSLFYDLVDPDNKHELHEFERFSYPFSVNKQNHFYLENVNKMKDYMDHRKYLQEYECSFEQDSITFFQAGKVKKMFDASIDIDPEKKEYICGIDYGMTEARTVVTLCTEERGIIYRLYYKEFPSGWDINNLIPFLQGLQERYKINKYVVDACPQGDAINKKMISMGWNVYEFSFHTEKIKGYSAFRNRINLGEIKTYPDEPTETQLLEMQQEETKFGKLMIHKRRGGRDDIVDSFVMATYPFLEEKGKVGVYFV